MTFVLDTCVLLADPASLLRFDEHDVVLPLVVVEELDRKKTRMDEVGTNARRTIRLLEDHGASRAGGLREAISLPSGGTLRIEPNGVRSQRLPEILDATTPDHRLLSVCLNLDDEGGSSVLVTKDAALRIKGAQLGVQVQDYRADTVAVDESYSGVSEIEVDNDFVDRLYAEGKAVVAAAGRLVNQYVVLRAPDGQSAVAQVVQSEPETIVVRVPGSRRTFGIESKNLRQAFAMDLLQAVRAAVERAGGPAPWELYGDTP